MSRLLPILFNTEMVRAILDGRKTVTRRLIKAPVLSKVEPPKKVTLKNGVANFEWNTPKTAGGFEIKMPYQPGDILYIRETWSEWTDGYLYKAWTSPFPQPGESFVMKWHPSIHMPKEAARIWLKVKEVRVERLQNMCLDDFINEGVYVPNEAFNDPKNAYGFAKFRYSGIWTSTIKMEDNDRYGWEANPWVWVIEFKRCVKPENF